ncbi:MAG: ferrous iron transport protein B [Deltaproteobacteria bacterium]|nr:ferrous iron transport protein B [Deltaproteobacteria bacterium]
MAGSAPPSTGAGLVRIALVGNPGAGRTTISSALTQRRVCMASFPGVAEERSGVFSLGQLQCALFDLPGCYSLAAQNPDERVACDVLFFGGVQVVVQVIDAANIERHLYLTSQLAELGVNLVLCLNMSDVARREGWTIDAALLSRRLGDVPVVQCEGRRRAGIEALRRAILEAAEHPRRPEAFCHTDELEAVIAEVEGLLAGPARPGAAAAGQPAEPKGAPGPGTSREAAQLAEVPRRFAALSLLEGDAGTKALVRRGHPRGAELIARVDELVERLEAKHGESLLVLLADRRWAWAGSLVRDVAALSRPAGSASFSDHVDRLLTHRLLGLPLYLLIVYIVFWLTFRVGEAPSRWIEAGFGLLGQSIEAGWPAAYLPELRSLLVHGVLAGVGGVLVFVPYIVLLFACLSLLQSTGYMARAAFLNDRLMRRIGLHGKSFLPIAVGFGCTVPAVMACRTLESERDRLTTMLILPLISCGSRLPIYLLLIPAYFSPGWWAPLMMGVYLFGMLIAALLARFLRSTLLSGEDSPFVMELPPYRLPSLRFLLAQVGRPAWLYLRKIGTIVLALSVVLWTLTTYPRKPEFAVDQRVAAGEMVEQAQLAAERSAEQLAWSAAGRIGRALEPVLAPMGFDWRLGTAFLGAMAAKEMFVAQMGIVFALGHVEEDSPTLRQRLAESYPPWVGLGVIIFALIASPCMSTLVIVRRESGSWRWPLLQWFALTLLAYLLATLVNLTGKLLAG